MENIILIGYFLTDKGFEEFPIISEMESNVCFKIALSQIRIK
jgi:hypothetical protein